MQNEASGWFAAASMASLTVIAAAMAAAAEPSVSLFYTDPNSQGG